MKIALDVRSTLKKKTGIGYYTLNLINALGKKDKRNSYLLYSYAKLFDLKRRLPLLPGENFKHKRDRFRFQPEKSLKGADIVQTSSYDMIPPEGSKMVVTVHDVVPFFFPEGYDSSYIKKYPEYLKKALDRTSAIAVDSCNTKRDLEDRFPEFSSRIKVIYPGKPLDMRPIDNPDKDRLKAKYNIDKDYILYVGSIEQRKNVNSLIKAFYSLKKEKDIPHILVIVGKEGWGGEKILEEIDKLGIKSEVRITDYITRSDLVQMYNASSVFVYPSLYEGFGLPILEAFSCGTPVITSSTSSCGEIASSAAIRVDPENIEILKHSIFKVLTDKVLSDELKIKGIERSKDFSWSRAAGLFLELFEEVALQ